MTSSATPSAINAFLDSRWLRRLLPFGAGVMAGTCLFVWTHQFVATFGVSHPVTAALTLSMATGAATAWWVREMIAWNDVGRYARSIAWLTIAVWTVGFPWMLAMARWVVGHIPAAWFESEATAFALLLTIGLALLALPVSALVWLGHARSSVQHQRGGCRFTMSTRFLLGCGLGLGTAAILLASWLSVEHIGNVVTGLAAVAFWISLTRASSTSDVSTSQVSRLQKGFRPDPRAVAWVAGVSLLTGAVIPLASRLMFQFLPGSGYEFYALYGGLACGVACGLTWAARLHRTPKKTLGHDGVLVAGVIVAAWPAVLLLVSPLLLRWMLSLNASVSNVPFLIAVRWLMGFLTLFPLGMATARVWSQRKTTNHGFTTENAIISVMCLAAGVVLMKSLWVSPHISLLLLTLAAVTLVVARLWKIEALVIHRRHWVAGTATVALVASLPLVIHNHRPDLAAELLFSVQTFSAHNAGIERDLLPHIDDGRLVALRDGRDAVWTVWKRRGSQLHLRQNGIPSGIVSTDPAVCPQFAGDIMHAIVPLVVHPQPDRVLVVGLGGTAAISTCLACPVQQVTCIEGDAELIRISDEVITAACGWNPLNDDRLDVRNVDPTLALLAAGERYDIVIVGDSHPSLLRLGSRFTREFYESTTRHLNEGGILCQRLQYADFGRQPIESILATLHSVFPQVACLEPAPGELVLLACNSEETMFDESLLDRCEADHIRRLMAQLGWDWSILLNLSAIGPEQVSELSESDVAVNTVSNGRFVYRLPTEVMRWGPKWREVAALFGERGSRMLAWIGESDEIPEVGKRLADMREQQLLIVDHPDRWHAYRATLKERLKERPRQQIIPVNHELKRALHPEDTRRKEYLRTLGAVATRETPNNAEIARVAAFAEPYDPLVSYFLHQEAARLYERAENSDRLAQFNHLRYSVYYGPGQDRSVRNVVAALELLIQKPKLIADPQQRWDEMNALLDVLRLRSSLRVETDKTASSFELIDAEKSIKIAERAMRAMDALREEAGIATIDWERRRTVLERLLVRPMWTYHTQQSRRLATIEARLQQTAEQETEDKPTTVR